jgi:hypothetical protein
MPVIWLEKMSQLQEEVKNTGWQLKRKCQDRQAGLRHLVFLASIIVQIRAPGC